MKHILNNILQEEKQRILELHSRAKTIDKSKLGYVKPLITEGVDDLWFTEIDIVLDGQTWEGQEKTFTGSWKAYTKNPNGFTLKKSDFELPSGGWVPDQINIKPNVETDIPFKLTLDPTDTNQKSIFNFLKRDKYIFFNIGVNNLGGGRSDMLTFRANFTQVATTP